MTKIKNFRIHLRLREMARWLKKERGLETTPELDVSLEQTAKNVKEAIENAAIYTTLTRQIAEKTMTVEFPKKAIAVSIIAVSVGRALEERRLAAPAESVEEALLGAVQQEALAQSLQFVVRLVQDQAKEEDCEMSPPLSISEAQAVSSLTTLLGVQRIGITLDASAPEIPSHVRIAALFWTPIGKSSSRRVEPTSASASAGRPGGHAEKVPV